MRNKHMLYGEFLSAFVALFLLGGLLFPTAGYATHHPDEYSNCGGNGQPICSTPIFPTCDTGHAQDFANRTCYTSNPNYISTCGGHNQSICFLPVYPTCDTGIAERLGEDICVNPDPNASDNKDCGGHNQPICILPIFPTCDNGYKQRLEADICVNPDPNASDNKDCGGNKQAICFWPTYPTCDTNLAQRTETGTCHDTNPNATGNNDCGGDLQPICQLPVFPTCDAGKIENAGSCFTPTACGQEDERACCGDTGETQWPDNPNLASAGCFGTPNGGIDNLVEVAGNPPYPAVCGGDNPLALSSNGRCLRCGSEGAQICAGDNVAAHERCQLGLTNDGFGFCTPCGGGQGSRICEATIEGEWLCDPGFHPDGGFCVADATIAEPDCDCEPESTSGDSTQPVRGYADLHLHLFANLAFGGMVVTGEAYDPLLGISGALRADNYAQRTSDFVMNGHVKQGRDGDVVPIDLFRRQQLVHGDAHVNDIVGFGTDQHVGPLLPTLSNGGVEWDANINGDNFVGWPRWNSTTHQQSYYTWLRRAHFGGLKLAVVMAVNNEAMCISGRYLDHAEFDCAKGMASIDLQIQKAYDLETWLNQQCAEAQSTNSDVKIERSCATPESSMGWFKVVRSPSEARAAIASGQLAVVLGIEEANVFALEESGCADAACFEAYVQQEINTYFDKGVRHIFPIHNFDNFFGGAATWLSTIAVGNRYVNDEWFKTENCESTTAEVGDTGDGYGFKLDPGFGDWLAGLLAFGVADPFLDTPDYYPELSSSCNTIGLTDLGEKMIMMLMKKGMIIDIDHMSNKSLDSTLNLAAAKSYPGVVASHALMFDLTKKDYRHERMRTANQLRRIASLGGMVGAMTQPAELGDNSAFAPVSILQKPGSNVLNDCQASSKTWAHSYEWSVEVMTVNGKPGSVAFGTDFNGISRHNAPRFGIDACGGQLSSTVPQAVRVQYPFTLNDPLTDGNFGTFDKQETGGRVFDYNEDGLAHIGMLPDMIQDLKKVGLSDDALQPLFQSAEAYILMWEKSLEASNNSDLDETCGGQGQSPCTGPICDTGHVVGSDGTTCQLVMIFRNGFESD